MTVGVHQVLVAAAPGDAITNMALGMRDLLSRAVPSEIYARHVHPALAGEVRELRHYRPHHARNVLIFHASIGQPEVHQFISERTEPLVLVYHNVTPSEFFEPYDVEFAEMLSLGRQEVERLQPRVVRAIAASQYNARELEAMGYRDVRVVPPVVDFQRLTRVTPRASTMNHLAGFDGPILLSVAQLMPHKRPDFLVEMMHCAETYCALRPVLMLVGHQHIASYARVVKEQVRELTVDVHVVGAVDDADLAAMYRSAVAVVSASEHEGFCVPLVEAMTFDKPVIARSFGAIPETVGDAGLLLPAGPGPTLFAEAVVEVTRNAALRADLAARGRRRVAELESASAETEILGALLEAV
jgi:glycosyltransferase involved in cell wall biosynthesis